MFKINPTLLLLLVAVLASGQVIAADESGQQAYTQQVKRAAAGHLAALGHILRREVPYEDHVSAHTDALLAIAQLGGALHVSDEEHNYDPFLQTWLRASEVAARVGRRGDLLEFAPAFRDLAASCKACHDEFRVY